MKKAEVGGKMAESSGATIRITVKFRGRSIPLDVSPDTKVKDLKTRLHALTNVLPPAQKLITRGMILADEMTLRESEVTNGAKIMLMHTTVLQAKAGRSHP